MKKNLLTGLAIWLFMFGMASAATINFLATQSNFSAGYEVINFDNYAHETAANDLYSSLGVEFSNFGAAPVPIYKWTSLPNYQTNEDFRITTSPDNVIATVAFANGSIYSNFLDINFTMPTYEIGAFFGNDQWNSFGFQTLSVFDINDNLIGGVNVLANINTHIDQFIGLSSDTAFYRARFENDSSGLSIVLDDVTFNSTVPEPATMLLLGIGIIGLAGLRKKVL